MPGPQINPDQKKKFFRFISEGWSQAQAAEKAGFSPRSAERILAAHRISATRNPTHQLSGETDDIPESGEPPPLQSGSHFPSSQSPADIPGPLRKPDLSPIAYDCLDDFGRFRARYFGRISSPWQENAADIVRIKLSTPHKEYGVINAPPGSGKSTLFTHDINAWLTARSRTLRGFIGSSTTNLARGYTGRLRDTLERPYPLEVSSEDLALGLAVDATGCMARDYGRFRPVYLEGQANPPWARDQFTVEQFGQARTDDKEATWTAFGAESGFLGWRVNFVVWDDLVLEATFATEEAQQKQRSWWLSTAQTRIEPGGLILLQGQRLGAEDLYRFCLDMEEPIVEDPDDLDLFDMGEEVLPTRKKYFHVIYKAHYDEHCHYDPTDPSTRLVHSRNSPPYDPASPTPGCLLDPRRLTFRELRSVQDQPLSKYDIVYQQEDVSSEDVLIPKVWIEGGRDEDGNEFMGCWDEDRGIAQRPPIPAQSVVTSTISVDPSPSKFWSAQWWVYVQPPGTPDMSGLRYLINLYRKPLASSDFLDFDPVTQTYSGLYYDWVLHAKAIGIPIGNLIFEINAAQKFVHQHAFYKHFNRMHGITFRAHTTGINKADPELGVYGLRPRYKDGLYRLPGTPEAKKIIEPMRRELTRYPDSVTDDCVMANWFYDLNLPHLVRLQRSLPCTYKDLPSWLRERAAAATRSLAS